MIVWIKRSGMWLMASKALGKLLTPLYICHTNSIIWCWCINGWLSKSVVYRYNNWVYAHCQLVPWNSNECCTSVSQHLTGYKEQDAKSVTELLSFLHRVYGSRLLNWNSGIRMLLPKDVKVFLFCVGKYRKHLINDTGILPCSKCRVWTVDRDVFCTCVFGSHSLASLSAKIWGHPYLRLAFPSFLHHIVTPEIQPGNPRECHELCECNLGCWIGQN